MKEEKKIKMSKTKTYLFHERSSIFPLIEGEAFEGLVEDIKRFGQLEDGVLFKGKILDGRNRYRACKILNIPFRTKEYSGKMDPLDYIISQNLHRRHLNIAQRSEIGLLLLEEEEKLAQERVKQMEIEKAKLMRLEKEKKDTDKKSLEIQKKISKEIINDLSKGKQSTHIVAPKVRISSVTLSKAKKIKKVAKKDPEIKKEWNKALKGESTVGAIYKKVQIKETIEKLPEDLKKEVKKENPVITVKEAKEIAEIPKPELRKEAVKFIKKQKKEQEMAKDYIMDVAMGKEKMPTKTLDLDMKIIDQFAQIYKQVVIKMTKRRADSYNEQTKVRLLKIMKEILIHLQKELNITGAIIEVEKS